MTNSPETTRQTEQELRNFIRKEYPDRCLTMLAFAARLNSVAIPKTIERLTLTQSFERTIEIADKGTSTGTFDRFMAIPHQLTNANCYTFDEHKWKRRASRGKLRHIFGTVGQVET